MKLKEYAMSGRGKRSRDDEDVWNVPGGYMGMKKSKLEEQYSEQAAAAAALTVRLPHTRILLHIPTAAKRERTRLQEDFFWTPMPMPAAEQWCRRSNQRAPCHIRLYIQYMFKWAYGLFSIRICL